MRHIPTLSLRELAYLLLAITLTNQLRAQSLYSSVSGQVGQASCSQSGTSSASCSATWPDIDAFVDSTVGNASAQYGLLGVITSVNTNGLASASAAFIDSWNIADSGGSVLDGYLDLTLTVISSGSVTCVSYVANNDTTCPSNSFSNLLFITNGTTTFFGTNAPSNPPGTNVVLANWVSPPLVCTTQIGGACGSTALTVKFPFFSNVASNASFELETFSRCTSSFLSNQLPSDICAASLVDAFHTLAVTSITVEDVNGNPIPAATATAVSGTNYGSMTATFSAFKNMLDTETSKSGTSFELVSKFTLGSNSDGINPLTEVTVLNVGSYSVTLPAGSFRKNSKGDFVYEGKIGGEQLEMRIVPGGSNSYTLNAEGSCAHSIVSSRPVPVGLEIGNDMGVGTATLD